MRKEIKKNLEKALLDIWAVYYNTSAFDSYENAIESIREFMLIENPILYKQAILVVCSCITFMQDRIGFPSVAYCYERFESVCDDLEHNRQVYLQVYNPEDRRANSEGFFTVGIF